MDGIARASTGERRLVFEAVAQPGLLEQVVRFKEKFYRTPWAKLADARPGTLRLAPPKGRLDELAADYASMRPMLFGGYPSIDEIVAYMAELEETPGIGPKVASCICLFGLGYLNAVPRDTWIKRAERETGMSWDERYGGIQQQYVFAWYREGAGRHERGV